jgi:hypothetical protein
MGTRSGQCLIFKYWTDTRSELQIWAGMVVIDGNPSKISDMRDMRLCRQLGNQAEISPQRLKESSVRDDGNTNPLCQLRFGQSKSSKTFRQGKLPNRSPGKYSNSIQFPTVIVSMAGRYSAVMRSSMLDSFSHL